MNNIEQVLDAVHSEICAKLAPTFIMICGKAILKYNTDNGVNEYFLRVGKNLNFQSKLSLTCLEKNYPEILDDIPTQCIVRYPQDTARKDITDALEKLTEAVKKTAWTLTYYKHILAINFREAERKYNINLENYIPGSNDGPENYFAIQYVLDPNTNKGTISCIVGIFSFPLIHVSLGSPVTRGDFMLAKKRWKSIYAIYPDFDKDILDERDINIINTCKIDESKANPLMHISWNDAVPKNVYDMHTKNVFNVHNLIRLDNSFLYTNPANTYILYQTGYDYRNINKALIAKKFMNDESDLLKGATKDGEFTLKELVEHFDAIYERKKQFLVEKGTSDLPESINLYRVSIASNFGTSCIPDIKIGATIVLPHLLSTYQTVSANLSNFTNYSDKHVIFKLTVNKSNYNLLIFTGDNGAYGNESEVIVHHKAVIKVTNITYEQIGTDAGIKEKNVFMEKYWMVKHKMMKN